LADFGKIEDLEELESWLETQDQRVSRTIAARASLRSLPVLMETMDQDVGETDGSNLLLAGLRATLMLGVTSASITRDMKLVQKADSSSRRSVGQCASSVRLFRLSTFSDQSHQEPFLSAIEGALNTLTSTFLVGEKSAVAVVSKTDSAITNATYGTSNSLRSNPAVSAAIADVEAGSTNNPLDMFRQKLWPSVDSIEPILEFWSNFAKRPDPDAIWIFWTEWYQGMLDGTPMDWDLQYQVALIEDAVWQDGAEAVAGEIERIRAKFDLEQEVKQLKEKLLSLRQVTTTAQIGDNGGPPLNDPEDIAFQTDLSQIWQRVEELENEIDSPTPSIDKLGALAAWFQAFFIRAAKYLGAKADIIFTKGCETIGTTGTKALIAYFTATTAAQNDTVHSLANAIWNFAKSLAGG
jgi:hypothetical protein